MEVSVVVEEDEEEDEVELAPRSRQGSILGSALTKKTSFEVFPSRGRGFDVSDPSSRIELRSYKRKRKGISLCTKNGRKNDSKVLSPQLTCLMRSGGRISG